MLEIDVIKQNGAVAGIRVSECFIARSVGIHLGVNRATTVVILAVERIAVIDFIQVHAHGILGAVHTVCYGSILFQEPHRLHILGALVSGGKVVGEDVITQDTFWAGVFIQVFLPCSLPVPAFGVIAGITEAQPSVEVIGHFLTQSVINGELVIIDKRFKVVSPCREGISRDSSVIHEFLNP